MQGPPPEQRTGIPQSQHELQTIEIDRTDQEHPQLNWIAIEDPSQSFLLHEDDYILDSYFNPEFDIWEVLIRLEPETETDE